MYFYQNIILNILFDGMIMIDQYTILIFYKNMLVYNLIFFILIFVNKRHHKEGLSTW